MKRMIAALVVTLLGLGSLAPLAEARLIPRIPQRGPAVCDVNPIVVALQNCRTIRINNYWDGWRNQTSNRFISRSAIRLVGFNYDGTINLWFRGRVFRTKIGWYKGKLCLYLGSLPHRPNGFLYELVVA